MRLIDADALKKDDELTEWITRDTIRTGKMLKAFSELFVKKINDAPTVNAVSEEVYTREYNLRKEAEMKAYKLEKAIGEIKAEIEPKCDRINSLASVLPYTAHREIQELLCKIMDLIKESEE